MQDDGQPVLDSDYALGRRKTSPYMDVTETSIDRDFVGISGLPGLQTTLSRDTEGQWTFTNLWTRAVVAYTRDTQDYPIGTHLWHFTGNVCSDGSVTRMMNLHRATGVGEFSCANGVTILMELKCDGYIDCADRSDEHNCSLIEGHQGTKARTAPLTDIYISHISAQSKGPSKPRRKTKVLTI